MCRCFRKDRNIGGFDFNLNYTIMTHYESLKEHLAADAENARGYASRDEKEVGFGRGGIAALSCWSGLWTRGETAQVNRDYSRSWQYGAVRQTGGDIRRPQNRWRNESRRAVRKQVVGAENRPIRMPWRPKAVSPAASADRLSGWVAAVIAGYVGHKMSP